MNLEELKRLGLDSISIKVYRGRDKLDYIDTNIEDWIKFQEYDDKYIINIHIDILGNNIDSDKEINIGRLEGNFFESEEAMYDTNFYEVCDCVGADLEPLASSIVDEEGNIKENICDFDENLMYIDRIFIEEKYRGLGIASYVLNSLNTILEYSTNLSPHVFIVLPIPQEKEDDGTLSNIEDEKQKEIYGPKLIKFYRQLGFDKIEKSNYMIKRTRERFI